MIEEHLDDVHDPTAAALLLGGAALLAALGWRACIGLILIILLGFPRALAAIADSPSLPRRELAEAVELAEQFRFPFRIVKTAEFENAEYLANPANRCYFCKKELFIELEPIARDEGFRVIAYGENASDVGDFRPGAKAAGRRRALDRRHRSGG